MMNPMTGAPPMGGMPMMPPDPTAGAGGMPPMGGMPPGMPPGLLSPLPPEPQPNLLQLLESPQAPQILQVLLQALEASNRPPQGGAGAGLSPLVMALLGGQGTEGGMPGGMPMGGGGGGY